MGGGAGRGGRGDNKGGGGGDVVQRGVGTGTAVSRRRSLSTAESLVFIREGSSHLIVFQLFVRMVHVQVL